MSANLAAQAATTKCTNVVVVEDNRLDELLIRSMLSSVTKYRLQCVTSLLDLRTWLSANQPDIVLLDMFLPDAKGLSTLQQAIELTDAPILLMSGQEGEAVAFDALEHGAVDFIAKGSMNATLLEHEIDRTLMRHRLRKQQEADHSDDDVYLASVAHELKTPVNGIHVLASLLGEKGPNGLPKEKFYEYIKTITTCTKHLEVLIGDMLDMSCLETGKVSFDIKSLTIENILVQLEHELSQTAKEKNLTLSFAMTKGCPKIIYSDETRLLQILRNLINNAIKYTNKGSVSLSISTTDESKLKFTVTDTGIGIPQKSQETIFQKFNQGDAARSRCYRGIGIGLYVSQIIAQALGGEIQLDSTDSSGSAFTLVHPIEVV